MSVTIERRYVDLGWGQVHVAICGRLRPGAPAIICLHQTPRSWDEFRELLPKFGETHRALAFDLPGMGASDPHPAGHAIEHYADAIVVATARLGIRRAHLIGHHTGGVVAIEVAAQVPDLGTSLVLSSTPYVDADDRRRRGHKRSIDDVEVRADGEHLTDLWHRRAPYYPPGRPDLLQRFVADAVRAPGSHEGHGAVGRYEMERRLPLVHGHVLLIGHQRDPFAFPHLERLSQALGRPHERLVIADGTIPLEASAPAVAEASVGFFQKHDEAR